jgi:hypothetical protein
MLSEGSHEWGNEPQMPTLQLPLLTHPCNHGSPRAHQPRFDKLSREPVQASDLILKSSTRPGLHSFGWCKPQFITDPAILESWGVFRMATSMAQKPLTPSVTYISWILEQARNTILSKDVCPYVGSWTLVGKDRPIYELPNSGQRVLRCAHDGQA